MIIYNYCCHVLQLYLICFLSHAVHGVGLHFEHMIIP
jgi:hypothetical protein